MRTVSVLAHVQIIVEKVFKCRSTYPTAAVMQDWKVVELLLDSGVDANSAAHPWLLYTRQQILSAGGDLHSKVKQGRTVHRHAATGRSQTAPVTVRYPTKR